MESKSWFVLGICWSLVLISAVFVGLRVYCGHFLSKGFWWDDHILIFSWILVLVDVIVISVNVCHGLGSHISDVDPQHIPSLTVLGLISISTSLMAAILSKVSFILTLLRITVCCARHFFRFGLITMNMILTLAILFLWLECLPINSRWDREIEGTCMNKSIVTTTLTVASAYSAFYNLALSLMPWRLTSKLEIHKKEKMGMAVMTVFGLFSCGAAITRAYLTSRIESDDFTYETADLTIWSVAEPVAIIVCACLPVLRLLFLDLRYQANRNYGVKVTCGWRGNCKTTKTVTDKASNSDLNSNIDRPASVPPITCRQIRSPRPREFNDGRSDRSILFRESTPAVDSKGILQVSEIKVEYSERKMDENNDDEETFDMQSV